MASTTRYEISHVSRCLYSSPVRGCVMSLCLKPRDEPRQRLLRFEIATNPLSSMNSETDCFGNTKHVLNIHREHEALEIVALSAIETVATAPPSGSPEAGSWEEVRSWRDSLAYWDFMHASALARPSARLKDFVGQMDIRAAGDPLEALTGLSDALHRGFEYVPGSTSVASSIDHVLENGQGVCQDYSHVMIAIARSWECQAATFRATGPWMQAVRLRYRRLTRGSSAYCPASVGLVSIPQTGACPARVMCASQWAATTKTWLRPAASCWAAGRASLR